MTIMAAGITNESSSVYVFCGNISDTWEQGKGDGAGRGDVPSVVSYSLKSIVS